MGLRPCWLSFRNFNAIAGFKVQLGQTWSRHSPQNRHSIVMGLRQYWLSLESISNLAGLEFNLDSTCFKNGPKMVPKKYTLQRHWPYTMLTQSWTFQCSSSSRSNVRTNMVRKWPLKRNSIDMGLIPCWLSLENFSVGLDVKLSQTWSWHGPQI